MCAGTVFESSGSLAWLNIYEIHIVNVAMLISDIFACFDK